ncbi:radical SAM protein [bacterium]|nr:radical SAM protein [candidate division CSSED10-310 bacterium]
MKVTLVKPCWTYPIDRGDSTYNRTWPPLSLLNCAAILRKQNIEVDVIDASAERLTPEQVAAKAQHSDMIFITSASLDRWQCPNLILKPFLKSVFALKRVHPNVFVMGTHGTVRPKSILDVTGVKAVIRGEPEITVLKISQNTPFKDINGLAYYENNRYMQTPDPEDIDLSLMPMPAYDLIDINRYNYEILGGRFALLEASRGCPYSCIFCVKSMYGRKFRVKPTEQFIAEIDVIIDQVKARNAYFIDLEFTVNRELVECVCDHLIKRRTPITWCCQTRADSVDLPILKKMRKAGCQVVHFGVETGSEKIRQTLHKGITFTQVEDGLLNAREAGLQTVCFFMFGLPGETKTDMQETIRFANRLNPTYASFHIALPYPGTEFHENVKDVLGTELFPNAYTGEVPYETLEKLTRQAFRKYYFRPRYIAGRLKDRDFSTFFRQAKFFMAYLKHRLWS